MIDFNEVLNTSVDAMRMAAQDANMVRQHLQFFCDNSHAISTLRYMERNLEEKALELRDAGVEKSHEEFKLAQEHSGTLLKVALAGCFKKSDGVAMEKSLFDRVHTLMNELSQAADSVDADVIKEIRNLSSQFIKQYGLPTVETILETEKKGSS